MVLGLGHGLPELCRVLKHADQDLQAVQVRVFRGDDLKNGLTKKGGGVGEQDGGKVWIKRTESGTFRVFVTIIRPLSHEMECWTGVSHLLECVIPFGILWNAIRLRFSLIQLLF